MIGLLKREKLKTLRTSTLPFLISSSKYICHFNSYFGKRKGKEASRKKLKFSQLSRSSLLISIIIIQKKAYIN